MRTPDPRWCSPAHLGRDGQPGLRSPDLFWGSKSKPLTDKAILKYALEGYYGVVALEAAKEIVEQRKRKKKK